MEADQNNNKFSLLSRTSEDIFADSFELNSPSNSGVVHAVAEVHLMADTSSEKKSKVSSDMGVYNPARRSSES